MEAFVDPVTCLCRVFLQRVDLVTEHYVLPGDSDLPFVLSDVDQYKLERDSNCGVSSTITRPSGEKLSMNTDHY